MSRPKNASLELNVSPRRPKYPKCADCHHLNNPCPHVVKPEEGDPTRMNIMFATDKFENGSSWRSAVASLDCGTPRNWVSSRVLDRFEKPGKVQLSPPDTYSAFEGEEYEATKAVWITWHVPKNKFSRDGLFCIVENGPFDVVIGSTFLFKEGIRTFDEAALLFFGRQPESGEEESLMQQTLKQYAIDRTVNQVQSSQQQPKETNSQNPRSNSAADKMFQDLKTACFNSSNSQEIQCFIDQYNASSSRTPPHPQQGVPDTSSAAPSPPAHTISVGTQTDGPSAAIASSLGRDPLH